MAHTFTCSEGTTFISNGDLSGDVIIVDAWERSEVKIPVSDLLQFVAHKVRSERTEELENMTDRAILGLHSEG